MFLISCSHIGTHASTSYPSRPYNFINHFVIIVMGITINPYANFEASCLRERIQQVVFWYSLDNYLHENEDTSLYSVVS